MDDMKREIYMLASEKINTGNSIGVCLALQDAVAEILGCNHEEISDVMLEELLPEFFQLFDGIAWFKIKADDGDVLFISGTSEGMHRGVWWQHALKEPRVRILNYILTCK